MKESCKSMITFP